MPHWSFWLLNFELTTVYTKKSAPKKGTLIIKKISGRMFGGYSPGTEIAKH